MKEYRHKSTDNGAMSQLDSVFTQLREKARSNPWEVIVLKHDDGTIALSLSVEGPQAVPAEDDESPG